MIYPTEYSGENHQYGKESGEEKFFYRFKNEVQEPGVVFYSLILKLPGVNEREIDFLYISRSGIFIIELKNSHIRINQNKWEYYNLKSKSWEQFKRKKFYSNPIEQLKTVSQDLLKFINIIHKGFLPISIESIYSVLFLAKNDNNSKIEIEDNSINIFYKEKISSNLQSILKSNSTEISVEQIRIIEEIILKNTNYFTTYERRMEEHSKKIIALTKQQYQILEDLEYPNILLSGVAGSGKTLIALEACRIAQKKGWSTLLICRSSNLNKYLEFICKRDKLENITIKTMSGFCNLLYTLAESEGLEIEKPKLEKGEDFLREAQPGFINSILHKIKSIPKFDFLIVDEAQDIMSFTELSILDQILTGGFEKGKWLVCYDEEQALFGELKEGLEYLESFSPKRHELSVNKRTPRSIYETACKLSKKSLTESDLDDHSSVHLHTYKTNEEGKEKLYKIIDNAVREMKFKVEDIVVLSPINKSNTEVIGKTIKLTHKNSSESYYVNLVNDGIFKNGSVGFSEIGKFKGMERKFIILTGVHDFSDATMKNTIYVALTRGTHHCTILINEKAYGSYLKEMK